MKLGKQFILFSIVGITSTILDFLLLIFLHEIVGLGPVWAAGISYVVSLIFNYLASMKYVFTHRQDLSRKKEALIFFVLSAIGLVINEIVMWLGGIICTFYHLNYNTGPYYLVAKVLADSFVGLWNFFSRRHWLDGSKDLHDEPPLPL